ncbi:hypothetical protein DPSP01_000460 [Paraphaeosphaeria sporulosa]
MMDDVDRHLKAATIAALNVPFEHHMESFSKARTVGGERVRPNDSVELRDGSFLRIMFITKDDDGAKVLHGYRLLRNDEVDKRFSEERGHYLMSLLPCDDRNELCAIVRTTTDTDAIDSFLVSEPLRNVACKRHIVITNSLWYHGKTNHSPQDHEHDAILFCRYKYIEKADLKRHKVSEFKLRRVSRAESDVDNGIAPFWLLHEHRLGQDRLRRSNEQYSYADVCAGAGGTSRAAILAGLTPQFLLDIDTNACTTLRLNFGSEVVLQMDVREFSQLKESGNVVDVVHFSFVCKGHSAANRHTNPERDAAHIALGYTLSDILKMCRPRIVTMEQVPGVENRSDDGQHLRAYIQALTENGYDCSWRIVNFQEHGLAQARKRIIILAACPGQRIPSWPRPTNGIGPQLLKPVTIKDALLLVPNIEDLPGHMLQHTRKPHAEHTDARKPLPSCITTSGGKSDVHPYEKRSFNMAELAALNGFPAWHRFPDNLGVTGLRELIGNAVPALSFKAFFDKVVEALKETDEDNYEYEHTEDRDYVVD